MGAVQDRSGITLATVKARLGVSGTAYDGVLEEILDAALEAADDFMNNPFTDADGAEMAIPAIVKRGVHALIKVWWELENGSGLENAASSVKEGDIQINFLDASGRGVAPIQMQFWAAHRLEPGL